MTGQLAQRTPERMKAALGYLRRNYTIDCGVHTLPTQNERPRLIAHDSARTVRIRVFLLFSKAKNREHEDD